MILADKILRVAFAQDFVLSKTHSIDSQTHMQHPIHLKYLKFKKPIHTMLGSKNYEFLDVKLDGFFE